MTSHDQAALELYQANVRRVSKETMEAMLEDFYSFPTKEKFDQYMRCVYAEFPCEISTSPSPSPSSEVSSSEY